ncbi:MAG TPA: hypothetical protein VFE46_02030 [Pirellulales bacterium]|jgi:hypothetical protein|nr:hypothetical protein [Pirellulales bacterium]
MTQTSNQKQQSWVPFPLQSNHFGDQVEFAEGGTVRLGDKAFADGRRIDYSFAGNTATRDNAFGATLTIRSADGQFYYFRYDGEQWVRRIPESDDARPFLHSLRQEMAMSGAVIGPLQWLMERLGELMLPAFLFVMVIVLPIFALTHDFKDSETVVKPIFLIMPLFFIPAMIQLLRDIAVALRRRKSFRERK